jgi:dihydrofolate reductase
MRKVVATVYTSLDGVINRPEKWSLEYFSKQASAYQTDLLADTDVLLQGRRTYESFAQFWNQPSEDAYNHRMYQIPKLLASRTLDQGTWNNTTVTDNAVRGVEKIRQDGDGLVLTYGFGSIAYDLLEANLLDELHVWIHPVLARDASPDDLLFTPGSGKTPFDVVGTTSLDSGVTILHLSVAGRS